MNWKLVTNAAVLLLVGLSAGITFNNWQLQQRYYREHSQMAPPRADRFREHFIEELQLSKKQQQTLDEIFEAQKVKLEALHDEVEPKFRAIHEETRLKLRAMMNDEQRTRFDAEHERREAMRERSSGRRGPPHDEFGPPFGGNGPPPHHRGGPPPL